VIPLTAPAVVEDRLAAKALPHLREAGRDFADRGVPVDLLETAVGAPAHRRQQAVAAVLVVVQTSRLLADVALGNRVRPVTPDASELPSVFSAQLHLDAAVALAENARGRFPRGGIRGAFPELVS